MEYYFRKYERGSESYRRVFTRTWYPGIRATLIVECLWLYKNTENTGKPLISYLSSGGNSWDLKAELERLCIQTEWEF